MLQVSCGIVIKNEYDEILMGHSTGNRFYDIPKGRMEDEETTIQCAIRECKEETSLEFSEELLIDLGYHEYNKQKNIHIYGVKVKKNSIDMSKLVCTTLFKHHYSGKMVPEFDSFMWVNISKINETCAKSMSTLLINNLKSIDGL